MNSDENGQCNKYKAGSDTILSVFEEVTCIQDLQEKALQRRIELLQLYKPSLLSDKSCGKDAFKTYGKKCIANICVDEKRQECLEIMWDMPCIFSLSDDNYQIFNSKIVMDMTEYDNLEKPRKY